MIKVRKASEAQYFNIDDREIADGLSLYVNDSISDEYTHRLQFTKNKDDVWLVSWCDGMNNLFFIADPEVPGTCSSVHREQFFDFVLENTPEVAEWCLFHLFSDKIEIEVDDDSAD